MAMDGVAPAIVRSPVDIFRDYRSRRVGIVKALTTDVEKFYLMCDPDIESVCLYGYPNETWDLTPPAEEVPPEFPEPVMGINFARDGMPELDWLTMVAFHSDGWLVGVAFYFGAQFGFDREARGRLFTMINALPTVSEIVTGVAKKLPQPSSSSFCGSIGFTFFFLGSSESSSDSESSGDSDSSSEPPEHKRVRT